MCVIVIGNRKHKPSIRDLVLMEEENHDGAGIAWTEKGVLRFEKGLKAHQIFRVIEKARSHWVAHFRWSTVGGTLPELCHPFLMDEKADSRTSGEAGQLLFHNGHWGDWTSHIDGVEKALRAKRPDGPWSDSRAAAWIAHHIGKNYLKLLPGKWCVFTERGTETFGEGWVFDRGMAFSNMNWKAQLRRSWYGTQSSAQSTTVIGGKWDGEDWRAKYDERVRESAGYRELRAEGSTKPDANGVSPMRTLEIKGVTTKPDVNGAVPISSEQLPSKADMEKGSRESARKRRARAAAEERRKAGRCIACESSPGERNPIGASGLCLGCIVARTGC